MLVPNSSVWPSSKSGVIVLESGGLAPLMDMSSTPPNTYPGKEEYEISHFAHYFEHSSCWSSQVPRVCCMLGNMDIALNLSVGLSHLAHMSPFPFQDTEAVISQLTPPSLPTCFLFSQNDLRQNVAAWLVAAGAIFWSIPVLLIQVRSGSRCCSCCWL